MRESSHHFAYLFRCARSVLHGAILPLVFAAALTAVSFSLLRILAAGIGLPTVGLAYCTSTAVGALLIFKLYHIRLPSSPCLRRLNWRFSKHPALVILMHLCGPHTPIVELSPKRRHALDALLLLIASFLIVWALPALLIYWSLDPRQYRHAIKIGTFLLSCGIGIAYYRSHRQAFHSTADRVTYFTGVCLGPAAAVEILT